MRTDEMNGTQNYCFDTVPDRNNSGCAKWNRRTAAEKAAGVIPLSVADMEFPTAPCVTEALVRMADMGSFGYADVDEAYYTAVAGWMRKRHDWKIAHEWIVIQNGVVPALSVAMRAFTKAGDAILMLTPRYEPFDTMTIINDRIPVYSELMLQDDYYYAIDFDDLERKASDPRVKMFLLCSPHNPTGRVWTVDELQKIASICLKNNVLMVSDEIHHDLELYAKHTVFCKAAREMQNRSIILTAPSKTFSVAGLQLANTIIPDETMRKQYVKRSKADGYSNPSLFGYHATIAAYTKGEAWVDAMLSYVRGNFEWLDQWLRVHIPQVHMLPAQGTYLALLDFRSLGLNDAQLLQLVRGEAMVILNEGPFFGVGGSGFMRMNLAIARTELMKALERLRIAIEKSVLHNEAV